MVLAAGAEATPDPPRLGFPSPPHFEARADPRTVDVTWPGASVQVITAVRGGAHTLDRRIMMHRTHVEVRDAIANPGSEIVGLRIRHAVRSGDGVWVGGRPAPEGADAYNPWNPTVFVPTGTGGVGLVAEDDVLRNQLQVDNDLKSRTAGLRTDMFCLGPGDTATLAWSIYPTAARSYWDFINTVRADWGVNRTVPGSYVWFQPDGILAMDNATLRARLARQRVAIASSGGGWVDPKRPERPPLIGFGTFVMGAEFASFRLRLRDAIAKLHAARPGIKVLTYFDAQRDSSPDADTRYRDSLLIGANGRPELTDWQGRFSRTWSMVPTRDNSFGRAMRPVPVEMRALGADGLYWDEIDAVGFSVPRLTHGAWDQRTCRLDSDGTVAKRVGLANLLSEQVKLDYAADGAFLLGNGPPTTRRFQDRNDVHMIEAQHNDVWGALAHLSSPLGYLSSRRDWDIVLEKIDEGLLVAGIPMDYPHDLVGRAFPFTPEYIQGGTLRGRERIITTVSGEHGWSTKGDAVRAFRYDADGKEHEADWTPRERDGGVYVRVELGPREAAIIER